MSPRFTHVLMAAIFAAPLFAGAALAQPSGGLGPNSNAATPEPANSLPRGGQAQGMGAGTNDGRIVLNPAQSAEAAPMARPARRAARRNMQRTRNRRMAPMSQSSGMSSGPAVTAVPTAGPGSMSNASPR